MPAGQFVRTKEHGVNISKAKKGKRTAMGTEFKKGRFPQYPGLKCAHCGNIFIGTHFLQRWCLVCGPDYKSRQILSAYDLSKPEHLKMIEQVNGMCPICNKRKVSRIDHSHETGRVRGVICGHCNIALPILEDQGTLERALIYLKRL